MTVSENIVSVLYMRTHVLVSKSCEFIVAISDENQKENRKRRIGEFNYFKNNFSKIHYYVRKSKKVYQCVKIIYTFPWENI